MEFKVSIGDPGSKRAFKAELKDADAEKLVGRKIGEKFKGELLGLAGYELEITGGSDNAGFPMRRDIAGAPRRKVILTGGVGFYSKKKGLRKRKSVRGNTISIDTAQINCKVVKAGSKKLSEIFGVSEKPAEKGEAKPAEAPKEKKEEVKEESKEEKPKAEKSKEKKEEKAEAPKEKSGAKEKKA